METQTLAILIAFAAVMLTLAGMILATLTGHAIGNACTPGCNR